MHTNRKRRYLRARANIARISYGNSVLVSWWPSVTSRYQFKHLRDRDSGFSLYDSLESLVFCDKISRRCVKAVSRKKGQNRGFFPKIRYFTAINSSSVKWLQINTIMMLIITSTGDELLKNVNIDDLEWPWISKIRGFSGFFSAISGCDTHFKSELHRNGWW